MKWNFLCKALVLLIIGYRPLGAVNLEMFYQIYSEPAPTWMMEQINSALAPFEQELSRQFLDGLYRSDRYLDDLLFLVRVRIVNGKITIERHLETEAHGMPDDTIPHIYALNSLITLPDVDFIFSAKDSVATISGCSKKRSCF